MYSRITPIVNESIPYGWIIYNIESTNLAGTDFESSVEDYLNDVIAKIILNVGPKPINTPIHQVWIHSRTALIKITPTAQPKIDSQF